VLAFEDLQLTQSGHEAEEDEPRHRNHRLEAGTQGPQVLTLSQPDHRPVQ
jgi:hypothetical protein